MKIGFVKFLNAVPFTEISRDVIYDIPSKINALLREKKLDVAFASSIEYLRGDYEYLPGICLAAHGSVGSVHFYLRKGCSLEGAAIHLDPASATSNTLFKILVERYWKCKVRYVESQEECDGFIKIGDEALIYPSIVGYETYDLSTLWNEMTHLPFVFALFIKQKGLDTTELERELNFSLERFINNFHHNIDAIAKRSGLPRSLLETYYKQCHYRLGPKELEGLKRFGELENELHAVYA